MSVSVVSPVFIGRQHEMSLLTAPVRRAEDGEPTVVLIGGEAGIGKTRLVGELAERASLAGFCVLTGQCIELGAEGLPLAPLVDALRALARITPVGELGELLGPGLARLLPELGPCGPAAPGDALAAAQLLELEGGDGPTAFSRKFRCAQSAGLPEDACETRNRECFKTGVTNIAASFVRSVNAGERSVVSSVPPPVWSSCRPPGHVELADFITGWQSSFMEAK